MNISINDAEKIVIGLIIVCLSFVFFKSEEEEVKPEVVIDTDLYESYPIIAWKDTHKKWDDTIQDIVRIKYRVSNMNTKIWVMDSNWNVVHESSIVRDPYDDGTPRDIQYVWKLYKTQRTLHIEPGDYTIVVGGMYPPYSREGKLHLEFTI
tara:strand:+ start:197 stop:649 length:453 start_codon:yes stop_codon:yes gene_type:complete